MNAECTRTKLRFQGLDGRDVVGRFDGGEITSDGGGVLLREVEHRTRILGRLSESFTDHRDPDRIEHSVEALIKQRVLGLCLGYEDLNDHDELCRDRLLALLCDRDDLTGEFRRVESDRGKPLAGKSTLNRLELTPVEGPKPEYKKIVADPAGMDELLLEVFLEAHAKAPEELILDLDATDDPLHGKQEGRFFHGYYKRYCYLPLYIFCGEHLLCARLRSSDRGAAHGVVPELKGIVRRLREAWPQVRITVCGDSDFSKDELMLWCETEGVDYVFGLAQNSRLKQADRDRDGSRSAAAAGEWEGGAGVPGVALPDAGHLVVRAAGGGKGGALAPGREPAIHRDLGAGPRVRWTPLVRGRLLRAGRDGESDQGAAVGPVCGPHVEPEAAGESTAAVFFLVRLRDAAAVAPVGAGGDGVGVRAVLDDPRESAEDRGPGPGHESQSLAVLFRELSVRGVVEAGPGPIASLPASMLAREGDGPLEGGGAGLPRRCCARV